MCSDGSVPRIAPRLAFAWILLAVGCATVNEPIPAPDTEPSSAPAPAEEPPKTSEPVPSPQDEAPPAPEATPSPGCKVGFQKDIMPKLVATCAQAACHASEMNRPYVVESSAQKTHDELMEFEFGSIEWSDPHSDYSGAAQPEFKKAIDAWRLCGAKLD